MDRSATYTIKGYLYQFNLTILKLLESDIDEIITVEGIEDIDILSIDHTLSIQCKYHEATEYNHSVIKNAIQFMLRGYKEHIGKNKLKIRYKYFGHFKSGQEKLVWPCDIDFLKENFLTTKSYSIDEQKNKIEKISEFHIDLGLTDLQLQDFINLLDIDINAPSYEEQERKIFKAFQEEAGLTCRSLDEAQGFFYSNALSVITELSRQHDVNDRNITKKDFLTKINTKQHFFDEWFLVYKTREQYIKYIKGKYFTGANRSPYERFFLTDATGASLQDIKTLILSLSRKYTKNGKRDHKTYCPYIYLHNFLDNDLKNMKLELQSEGICFIDGFDFENADFSPNSITRDVNSHNQICLKFINKIEFIDKIIAISNKTKEIYQFYLDERIYKKENKNVKQVSILIQSISDVEKMI